MPPERSHNVLRARGENIVIRFAEQVELELELELELQLRLDRRVLTSARAGRPLNNDNGRITY